MAGREQLEVEAKNAELEEVKRGIVENDGGK